MERRVSQRMKQGECIPEASPGPELSLLLISARLVTRGSQSQGGTLRVLLLSSLYPFFRKQNQPGSPGPSAEAGRARIQSVLIELALKQLIESQLLSLNGQFYCILMENVIIGWAQLTENTFLSLSLSHFCSHPQPIVNRI